MFRIYIWIFHGYTLDGIFETPQCGVSTDRAYNMTYTGNTILCGLKTQGDHTKGVPQTKPQSGDQTTAVGATHG